MSIVWAASNSNRLLLDAIDANIVVLDIEGVILCANQHWRTFAHANGLLAADSVSSDETFSGVNYLEICKKAVGESSDGALAAYRGIRSVLEGRSKNFTMEYPCHGPDSNRWFRMHVNPISRSRPRQAVVMHYDITKEKLAASQYFERYQECHGLIDELSALANGLRTDDLSPVTTGSKGNSGGAKKSNEVSERLRLLSERERAVLRGLVRGARIVELAEELNLSPKSVTTYRTRLLDKLKVENNAQLVSMIGQLGYFEI